MRSSDFGLFLTLLLASSLVGCTKGAPSSDKGGEEACAYGVYYGDPVRTLSEPGAQSVVAVGVDKQGRSCSGTLISPNQVLTAAHCVRGGYADTIFFGLKTTTCGISRKVVHMAVMPPAPARPRHRRRILTSEGDVISEDVAILTFEGSLPTGYRTASFASMESPLTAGISYLGFGFGLTDKDSFGVLNKYESAIDFVDDGVLIGKSPNGKSTSCLGDSGGPWFVSVGEDYKLIGLVSAGDSDVSNICFMGATEYSPDFSSPEIKNFVLKETGISY